MTAGDQIVVDMAAITTLDGDAALFDDAGRFVYENDDRNLDLNQLNPFINFTFRRTSTMYYLGIQSSALADPAKMTGGYDVTLNVVRGGQVPPTQGQIIVLDFAGGTITVPGNQTYTVGPFNTADIDSRYAGMTATVRLQIQSTVLENYAGLNLDVR